MPLAAGDIAIVLYNSDNADEFAFVALAGIPTGETISFTDGGWTSGGTFRSGEQTATWTNNTGAPLAAGTVITIRGSAANNSIPETTVGSVAGEMPQFTTAGDQVLAYQGLPAAPTFLTGLTTGSGGGWDVSSTTTSESALPTGLTDGVNAVSLTDVDNYAYAGPTIGTAAEIRAAIADETNWTQSSNTVRQSFAETFLIVTPNDDVLAGGISAETIDLLAGNDTFNGGAGADNITGGLGNDTLTGGADADTFVYDVFNATGTQADLVTDFAVGVDQISFGVNGPASYSMLLAGMLRTNGSGDAELRGVFGGNLQTMTLANVATGALSSSDFAFDTSATPRVVTSPDGDSYLFGGLGNDSLTGGNGSDVFLGDAGADTMTGNLGDDRYFVDNAGDVVNEVAGQGTDSIYASISLTLTATQSIEYLRAAPGVGGLTLTGNDYNINIYGNTGNDTLTSGAGNDLINGGAGADSMTGGAGNDTYFVDNAGDVVIEGGSGGTDNVYASVSYDLAAGQEIESLRALGGTGAVTLRGNEFANVLAGAGGADSLYGGAGNDRLDGGLGADDMHGDGGNDIFYVDNAGDKIFESFNEGTDSVYASVSYTLQADQHVEILRATAGSAPLELGGNNLVNQLYGNTGGDTLNGGGGNDILNGMAGADSMSGGTGDDRYFVDNAGDQVFEATGEGYDTVYASVTYALAAAQEIESLRAVGGSGAVSLTGNEIANTVVGASGNDTLDGGAGGDDILMGGGGSDTFHFVDGWGTDRVIDFEDGIDLIDLRDITGLDSFAQLAISQDGPSALVEFGGDSILIFNMNSADLTDADFML